MALDRSGKEKLRVTLEGRFSKANASIVAEYRGLTVAELTELRRNLRKCGGEFHVIKSRVAKKAVEALGFPDSQNINNALKGPIGVIYLYGDPAQGAKAVVDFEKNQEKFKVTAGIMEGKKLSSEEVKVIASLPSKEVLLGQIVGLLVSPHRGLLGVLNGVPRQLVQVINGIKDKKTA